MNADTRHAVEKIRQNRWYLPSQGLGEGGWSAVQSFMPVRKRYLAVFDSDPGMTVVAENDEAAIRGFEVLCHADAIVAIIEIVTTHRTLDWQH